MTVYPALIAVFGATGTGKTTFVNDASGGNLRVGDDLEGCTQDVAVSNGFQVDGRDVYLFDTPGFDDTEVSDTDILKRISAFLIASYEQGHKLSGIIYLHRISDGRMGGISRRTFRIFRELCGQKSLANVLIVTNMWSDPPTDLECKRESQLREDSRYFQPAIEAGAQLIRRSHKNTASAHQIIRQLLDKGPVIMQVQHELADNKQEFFTTGAAQILGEELVETTKKHQKELDEVKEELRVAKEGNDVEGEKELREFLAQAIEGSARLAKEVEALRVGFDEERSRWEKRADEAHQERRESERRQEELREEIERLRRAAEIASEDEKSRIHAAIDLALKEYEKAKSMAKSSCVIM